MVDLGGRVALVTGAGKGSGRRIAQDLAIAGVKVVVNDISPLHLDMTLANILSADGEARACVADIAKKMPIQGLLNEVIDQYGRLDILVNCAEVEPLKTVIEMDEWDWMRTLDVNLTGAFLLTQSAGRIMKEAGGGTIIHLAARAKGLEKHTAYLASKAALQSFVSTAAAEFAPFGIHLHLAETAEAALEACRR